MLHQCLVSTYIYIHLFINSYLFMFSMCMKSSLPYSLVGIMEAIDSRWTHHSRYISTFAAPLVHPCSHSLRLVSRSSQTSNSRFGSVTTLALQLNFRRTIFPPSAAPHPRSWNVRCLLIAAAAAALHPFRASSPRSAFPQLCRPAHHQQGSLPTWAN